MDNEEYQRMVLESLNQLNARLDGMDARFDGIDKKLFKIDSLDYKVTNLDAKIGNIDSKLDILRQELLMDGRSTRQIINEFYQQKERR